MELVGQGLDEALGPVLERGEGVEVNRGPVGPEVEPEGEHDEADLAELGPFRKHPTGPGKRPGREVGFGPPQTLDLVLDLPACGEEFGEVALDRPLRLVALLRVGGCGERDESPKARTGGDPERREHAAKFRLLEEGAQSVRGRPRGQRVQQSFEPSRFEHGPVREGGELVETHGRSSPKVDRGVPLVPENPPALAAPGSFLYATAMVGRPMPPTVPQIPLRTARRLAMAKQHLAGPPSAASGPEAIVTVVRDLGYVQWDPVTVVAPSHHLSFWARLADYRPADLERLLWTEKRLFEHWTPIASIVLTEDLPIFRSLMHRYPESLSRSWGAQRERAKEYLARNAPLRRRVLTALRRAPRTTGEFADHHRTKRDDGDWAPASELAEMLFHLTMTGEVMVVGHRGNQNLWGLSSDFLPPGVAPGELSAEDFERAAASRTIRALGTATPREITLHFLRGRYEHLANALQSLEAEGTIRRVRVEGGGPREERYIHAADLAALDAVTGTEWQPRTTLVPPFDNLVISQARGRRIFGFDYVREQFLPKEKRRFGTYLLPIVHGERLIGRVDPRFDADRGVLEVLAVHAEPDAPREREVALAIADAIHRLGTFVGAKEVTFTTKVPAQWRRSLR